MARRLWADWMGAMDAGFWKREQQTTEEQIRRCLAGDAQAWEGLVTTYQARIYSICYSFTESHWEAEDLTQDVLFKLFCNLSSYDACRGNFYLWLKNVTRNHLVDQFRRTQMARRSTSLDCSVDGEEGGDSLADRLADSRPSQEEDYARQEVHRRVHAAVERLPACNRDAVVLVALEERDYREAAGILRIQEGTVKSRLSRGRAELARMLRPLQPMRV